MNRIYFGLLLFIASSVLQAQTHSFDWAKSIGGGLNDQGRDITTDALGNLYVTGVYQGTVDFDPGVNTYNLVSAGGYDGYLLKLDTGGNFVWAKSFGGTLNLFSASMFMDDQGFIYMTGYFNGSVDFDPSPGTAILTAVNGDAFILKLDTSGNYIWAKSIAGSSAVYGNSITTDTASNVYLAGSFNDTTDMDPGVNTFNLVSNGSGDIFILKLDFEGNFVWAKSMGSANNDWAGSIALDNSGNIYTTGKFELSADFDPGLGIFNLISSGDQELYVQKLDNNGNFIWAESFGGTLREEGFDILTTDSGYVYVSGFFEDVADFDPGTDTFNLASNGQADIFLLKLKSDGKFQWAIGMGGNDHDVGVSIGVDYYGDVYLSGMYANTVDFDPGSATSYLTSVGDHDLYILKLDGSGNFIWVKSMGGALLEWIPRICFDAKSNLYSTGIYSGSADFNPDSATYILNSNGGYEIFILKLKSDFPTVSVELVESKKYNHISVFPNPNNGIVNINFRDVSASSIRVFNVHGTLVHHEENITSTAYTFALDGATGMYIIEINSKGNLQHLKLIKE